VASDELLLETEPAPSAPPPPVSVWPALALIVVAVLLWYGFQGWNLQREHRAMQTVRAGQESALQQAQQRRGQFQSIARRLVALAEQGHPGATLLVQELARRGYNARAEAPAPAPSPTPPK
jgi:hypothetical protein